MESAKLEVAIDEAIASCGGAREAVKVLLAEVAQLQDELSMAVPAVRPRRAIPRWCAAKEGKIRRVKQCRCAVRARVTKIGPITKGLCILIDPQAQADFMLSSSLSSRLPDGGADNCFAMPSTANGDRAFDC
ncbi:D-aminoacyl-tRNA deacylase [Mesorhizobium microcysteis]|uniref:D-aminoacyl-tRNA deacylase n=1 Tax=Neoaquamicrobium microcysteis TaxID=2682781 RepID=A0A5D4H7T7_9HYPH|nr:D-aminoacyl-tRNA deacylase [Mesorhizobium microcysteis]TYR37151.1 D-aminoacyl-tRNA deacylase [Mesorhizobium microcysteis]